MVLFKSFYENLLSWQFLLICSGLFPIVLIQWRNRKTLYDYKTLSNPPWISHVAPYSVLAISLCVTIPFYIDGNQSAIGTFDDCWFLLMSHVASWMRYESPLWNRILAGGNDFYFLHVGPFSSARLYAHFLEIWQEYTLIIIINMMLMFVYCYKIFVEILKTNKVMAFLGSLLCALTQGFWSEGKWPDGHVAYGHGMTLFPAMIYYIHKYFNNKCIWLYVILMGLIYSFLIPLPLHTPPMAVLTLGLWIIFFHGSRLRRCFSILTLFALIVLISNTEFIIAVVSLLPESGRGQSYMPTVRFLPFGIKIWYLSFVFVSGLTICLLKLNLLKDKLVIRMLVLPLAFLMIPVFAYLIQTAELFPGYRWSLLYLGNQFIYILSLVYLVDRIIRELYCRSWVIGRWLFLCSQVLLILLCTVWFFNDIGLSLESSYSNGGWNYLTNNRITKKIASSSNEPFKILNYGTDIEISMLGVYDGLELAGGSARLIGKNQVDFWQYVTKGLYRRNPDALGIKEEERNDLSSINIPLLKLMNIKYLFSKKKLHNDAITLFDFMPELGLQNECNLVMDEPHGGLQSAIMMWGSLFNDIGVYFWNFVCLWNNRDYTPPLYVYQLRDPFPKIYLAREVRMKRIGEEFSDSDYIEFVNQKNGIISFTTPPPATSAQLKTGEVETTFSGKGGIHLINYKQDRIDFRVNVDTKQFVILSDTTHRFWKLFINGHPADSHKTNIIQTGFFVDSGESNVSYIYCPPLTLRATAAECKLNRI